MHFLIHYWLGFPLKNYTEYSLNLSNQIKPKFIIKFTKKSHV